MHICLQFQMTRTSTSLHTMPKKNESDGDVTRAQVFAEWAESKFGLTASVGPDFDSIQLTNTNMPTSIRFMEIDDNDESRENDKQQLLKAVQFHTCSGFCMRDAKDKK